MYPLNEFDSLWATKTNKKLFPLSIGPRTKNKNKNKKLGYFPWNTRCLIGVHYNSHINWVVFHPQHSSPQQPSRAGCGSFFHLATSPLGLLFLLLGNFFRCLFFRIEKAQSACSFISKRDTLNNISHKISEINNTQHLKMWCLIFFLSLLFGTCIHSFCSLNNGRQATGFRTSPFSLSAGALLDSCARCCWWIRIRWSKWVWNCLNG